MANNRFGWHSGVATGKAFKVGSSASPQSITSSDNVNSIYATSASTSASSSVEPLYVKLSMTGAGGVGGRSRFHLYTNVALGGWSNALKAYVEYGASGRTAGLGSAICAEMDLSAGTSSGSYTLFEGELNLASGALTGTLTSLIHLSVNGADASTFDTNGYVLNLQGVSVGSGQVFQENTAGAATHALRIIIGATPYYIMLTDTGA